MQSLATTCPVNLAIVISVWAHHVPAHALGAICKFQVFHETKLFFPFGLPTQIRPYVCLPSCTMKVLKQIEMRLTKTHKHLCFLCALWPVSYDGGLLNSNDCLVHSCRWRWMANMTHPCEVEQGNPGNVILPPLTVHSSMLTSVLVVCRLVQTINSLEWLEWGSCHHKQNLWLMDLFSENTYMDITSCVLHCSSSDMAFSLSEPFLFGAVLPSWGLCNVLVVVLWSLISSCKNCLPVVMKFVFLLCSLVRNLALFLNMLSCHCIPTSEANSYFIFLYS